MMLFISWMVRWGPSVMRLIRIMPWGMTHAVLLRCRGMCMCLSLRVCWGPFLRMPWRLGRAGHSRLGRDRSRSVIVPCCRSLIGHWSSGWRLTWLWGSEGIPSGVQQYKKV